jgi:hypothetical protein
LVDSFESVKMHGRTNPKFGSVIFLLEIETGFLGHLARIPLTITSTFSRLPPAYRPLIVQSKTQACVTVVDDSFEKLSHRLTSIRALSRQN